MQTCHRCKELISRDNTITEEGIKEVSISGICERCFDNITFDMESNLKRLDQFVLSLVGEGVILAGGCLRKCVDVNDVICDYDFFLYRC